MEFKLIKSAKDKDVQSIINNSFKYIPYNLRIDSNELCYWLDNYNKTFNDKMIPVLTYGCLKKMNMVIYHPAYNHMYSDCELYLNLKELNLLYDDRLNDETIFEHRHFITGKRQADQADQIYYSKWQQDEITWKKRLLMTAEERIKI